MRFGSLHAFAFAMTYPCAMGFIPTVHKGRDFMTSISFQRSLQSNDFKSSSPNDRKNVVLRLGSDGSDKLPTLEQTAKDSFMQQISHAGDIVAYLAHGDSQMDDQVTEILTAQLSHVDGLRGFFATYLTGLDETVADQEDVPPVLLRAMENVDQKQLIEIACKCVSLCLKPHLT